MRLIFAYFIVFLIGIAAGMVLCRQSDHFQGEREMVQTDTLIVRDTVVDWHPVEVRTETIDTMRVIVRDTVRLRDTLYMSLPLEKKMFASDEYYAEVSGYKPKLDYIEVYPKTIYVTQKERVETIKKNQFSIGIGAEYHSGFGLPVQAQYTRNLLRYFDAYTYLEYDLRTKGIGAGIGLQMSIDW